MRKVGEDLQNLLEVKEMEHWNTLIIKTWEYIRKNDMNSGKMIKPNKEFATVFGLKENVFCDGFKIITKKLSAMTTPVIVFMFKRKE